MAGIDIIGNFDSVDARDAAVAMAREEFEGVMKELGISAIQNSDQLRMVVARWAPLANAARVITAGAAGALKVPDGAFGNPFVAALWDVGLGGIVGLGRAVSDAGKATDAFNNAVDSKVSKDPSAIGGNTKPWDQFYRTPALPGLAHLVYRDAAGYLRPNCDLVSSSEMMWKQHNRKQTSGNRKGGGQVTEEALNFPGEFIPYDVASRQAVPCKCVMHELSSGWSQISKDKTPIEKLTTGAGNGKLAETLARIAAMIEDPGEGAILEHWTTCPTKALQSALKIGLDEHGHPTEETKRHVLATIDRIGEGKVTWQARLERTFGKAMEKLGQGDLSGAWKVVSSLGYIGLFLLLCFVLWGAAFLGSAWTFVSGWINSNSWDLFYGALWTWVVTLFIPIADGPLGWLGGVLRGITGSQRLTNEVLRQIGRDIARFVLVFGPANALTVEMGYGDGARGILAVVAMFLVAAFMTARRLAYDTTAWRYGLDVTWRRQMILERLFRFGENQYAALTYSIPVMLLAYFTVGHSIDIPFQTLRVYQDGTMQVEKVQDDGSVAVVEAPRYMAVTPQPYGLRQEHEVIDLVGYSAVKYNTVTIGGDRVLLAPAGQKVELPGFIMKYGDEPHGEVSYAWKPGLAAQLAYRVGWEGYAKWLYPKRDAKGEIVESAGGSESSVLVWGLIGTFGSLLLIVLIVWALSARGSTWSTQIARGLAVLILGVALLSCVGAIGVSGCHALGAAIGDRIEAKHEPKAQAPTPKAEGSKSAKKADSAPKGKAEQEGNPCEGLSDAGREICLEEQRKAQANR
jgi:hypothetical protein